MTDRIWDLVVVGGGAAGLMAAIRAAETAPGISVAVLDGAKRLGAKIRVSGGGRCNVTNEVVLPSDFNGERRIVARVLEAFPAGAARSFFEELGVPLKLEPNGKLFPVSDRSRDILDALTGRAAALGVEIVTSRRVAAIRPGFALDTASGTWRARRVVLATGGRSLPRSGSDGTGYGLAASLGHAVTPTTPALVPLTLAGDLHQRLSGISLPVRLTLTAESGKRLASLTGSLLWTHFGISGPAPMDMSRHWLASPGSRLVASFLPEEDEQTLSGRIVAASRQHPGRSLQKLLAGWIPERMARSLLGELRIDAQTPLARLRRQERGNLVAGLLGWELPVGGTRGYNHAEVTSGGVPLSQIHAATMESRLAGGLYLAGEILDVDGRIGGFNFQWAWSSGHVAGRAAARSLSASRAHWPT